MLTLIDEIELYDPVARGKTSLLLGGGEILKIGDVARRALDELQIEYEVISGRDRIALPGIIDPHEHLRGGSGEGGFGTETPTIFIEEIARGGITTVVGTLGVDTSTTVMPGLLARVKGLRQLGLSAYLYTGGYNVPPATITDSVRNDILFVAEVIGAGEIAISDRRSTDPDPRELARIVDDAHVAGILSGKAGVTHFHVGEKSARLKPIHQLLDDFNVSPDSLYPTHLERNEALMDEGLDLVRRGVTIDIDVIEKDLAKWLRYYLAHDGDPTRLTCSSDSFSSAPENLFRQVRNCVLEHGFTLEQVWPHVSSNTARILKLPSKGRVVEKFDADVLVLEQGSLEVVEVIAGGERLVRDGEVQVHELFLKKSDREIRLLGEKTSENT